MNKKGGIGSLVLGFLIGTFFGYVILNWGIKLIKGWLGI
jgi:hypothetical protein